MFSFLINVFALRTSNFIYTLALTSLWSLPIVYLYCHILYYVFVTRNVSELGLHVYFLYFVSSKNVFITYSSYSSVKFMRRLTFSFLFSSPIFPMEFSLYCCLLILAFKSPIILLVYSLLGSV